MANKGRAEAGKALEAARVAEAEAASHRATAAQKQKQIAELEDIYGVSKTLVTVSGKVCRVHMCDTSLYASVLLQVSPLGSGVESRETETTSGRGLDYMPY